MAKAVSNAHNAANHHEPYKCSEAYDVTRYFSIIVNDPIHTIKSMYRALTMYFNLFITNITKELQSYYNKKGLPYKSNCLDKPNNSIAVALREIVKLLCRGVGITLL